MQGPGDTEELRLALDRERERVRSLREVGLLLDSTVPRDELLRRVLAAAARVTLAERATLYLVDEGGTTLSSHATEGGGTQRIVLHMGEGIAGTAASERRSIAAPDAYGDPRFAQSWDQRTGFRTRSNLASPLLAPGGHVVGVLQVLNRGDGGPFDQDDVSMLEALSAQAAVAIEGARHLSAIVERNRALDGLREQLERGLRERNLLLEIEQLLSRAETLDAFVSGALEGVLRECNASAGVALLADEPGARLTVRAVAGLEHRSSMIGAPLGHDTLAGRLVARGGESECVPAPGCADVPAAGASVFSDLAPRALLVVTLPSPQGPVGVIELSKLGDGGFSAADADLLTLVAANVATGVVLAHARRERERATRLAAVGRTLSNVLHDIRTPMTIISGYAQLMAGIDDAAERERHAGAIGRQFQHIQAMIGELLAFVRGESQLLPHQVFLERFFQETVETLRRDLSGRGVRVTLEVRDRGSARFDSAKITRMVHNLARNAADALGPEGGLFEILVERQGPDVVMSFRDNGPGIPENVRGQLFESFVTANKPGGTGLGLPMVKKVVEEHQGTLDVATGATGTTFTVRIPAAGPASRSMTPKAPDETAAVAPESPPAPPAPPSAVVPS